MNTDKISYLLRKAGFRATPQRIAIAKSLLTEARHCTPQALYDELRNSLPTLSANTIYTTLIQFEEQGLVKRFHIDNQTVFDSNTTDHDHAYCVDCGKIQDVKKLTTTAIPPSLSNWQIRSECNIWYGLCEQCGKKNK